MQVFLVILFSEPNVTSTYIQPFSAAHLDFAVPKKRNKSLMLEKKRQFAHNPCKHS